MLYQIFLECAGFYDGGTGFAETLREIVSNPLFFLYPLGDSNTRPSD
jgi:hypothetical protein